MPRTGFFGVMRDTPLFNIFVAVVRARPCQHPSPTPDGSGRRSFCTIVRPIQVTPIVFAHIQLGMTAARVV